MKKQHIHLVGIKGVAMAALAVYLCERGVVVTGSDISEPFPTDGELKKIGITVYAGFDAKHIETVQPDMVYYTGAHGGSRNPEVLEAVRLGIPVIAHGKALGGIMKGFRQLVVAGSHGKTTTSAMLAMIFLHAGIDSSYAVGCGEISGIASAGHAGRSEWFIAEGDEYMTDPAGNDMTPRFLWTKPDILIVTNIDYDHPDVYSNLESVQGAFKKLQNQSARTIVNADDANSRILLGNKNVQTFGYSRASDIRITRVHAVNGRMMFALEDAKKACEEFVLRVPGDHNVSNAAAAAIGARAAGLSWEAIHTGLLAFTGTKRRFERIGEVRGISVYDDYAHHPAEIEATLRAARLWYPKKRIIAVFQPHTYSRTKALFTEFARAFRFADMVIITDIYASARESRDKTVRGSALAACTKEYNASVLYAKKYHEVQDILITKAVSGDCIICMGAGDIYTWGKQILNALEKNKV